MTPRTALMGQTGNALSNLTSCPACLFSGVPTSIGSGWPAHMSRIVAFLACQGRETATSDRSGTSLHIAAPAYEHSSWMWEGPGNRPVAAWLTPVRLPRDVLRSTLDELAGHLTCHIWQLRSRNRRLNRRPCWSAMGWRKARRTPRPTPRWPAGRHCKGKKNNQKPSHLPSSNPEWLSFSKIELWT